MYEVTITITRLFDIHRRPAARFNSKHTVFGFETNEFKKPFVRVDGWPRLEVGDTLVVLLAKKDDWQSIYGWKNKATGQVCAASLSRSASNFGIAIALAAPFVRTQAAEPDVAALLRGGGVVIAFRHALAPGTFDPPGFRIGECGTQRNLNDEGRAQARRIGAWFSTRSLKPARVLSSPWCRCVDTATLAFGRHEVWPALGSPRGYTEETNVESLTELRRALGTAAARRAAFEVWSTHMFVLSALTGQGVGSGEGLVLRADAKGEVQLLARLPVA